MIIVNNENGRSMIEMLGVLAIIGVLSVGGIAGYSKAMMKYKINKTIEQITLIAGNVRTFFSTQKNYYGLPAAHYVKSYDIIRKAKLVPDEMWNDDKTSLINSFGSSVTINASSESFGITFSGIPQEACIELVTKDWSESSPFAVSIGDVALHSIYGGGITYSNCKSKSGTFAGSGGKGYFVCGTTIPLDEATTYCLSTDNKVCLLFK